MRLCKSFFVRTNAPSTWNISQHRQKQHYVRVCVCEARFLICAQTLAIHMHTPNTRTYSIFRGARGTKVQHTLPQLARNKTQHTTHNSRRYRWKYARIYVRLLDALLRTYGTCEIFCRSFHFAHKHLHINTQNICDAMGRTHSMNILPLLHYVHVHVHDG